MPNGMYIEGAPVIECALITGRSLHDMLLQSWGGKLHVFPAMPKAWADSSFQDLRGEGAFLVSARRQNGKTSWIRVRSLAGEPCLLVHGLGGVPTARTLSGPLQVKDLGNGVIELPLNKGQEALVFCGSAPNAVVRPIELDAKTHNYWGCKKGSGRTAGRARPTTKKRD